MKKKGPALRKQASHSQFCMGITNFEMKMKKNVGEGGHLVVSLPLTFSN